MKFKSLLLILAISAGVRAETKPNLVFILADDLGWNGLSVYGSKFHETPNIDALAKRGMKFNRAYSPSPLCSPTRSGILSGISPARTGVTSLRQKAETAEPSQGGILIPP